MKCDVIFSSCTQIVSRGRRNGSHPAGASERGAETSGEGAEGDAGPRPQTQKEAQGGRQ